MAAHLLVATGKWVASWFGAVSVLPSISGTALLLIVLGGLWLCLWQTRWRALGLVIVAAGLLVSGEGTKPDVLVERDGRNVALRAEDGSRPARLTPAIRAPARAMLTTTSASTAIQMSKRPPLPWGEGWGEVDCDRKLCHARVGGHPVINIGPIELKAVVTGSPGQAGR